MPGTEGALEPFFSPDGQWVGFFADGKLQKVSVAGGAPLTICDIPGGDRPHGVSWGPHDTIVFIAITSGLWRVSAGGGTPEQLTTPDPETGEISDLWPHILPDGKNVLLNTWTTHDTVVLSLETGERRMLLRGSREGEARYLPTGHLLYAGQLGGLLAVPFDLARVETSGSPQTILDDVYTSSASHTLFAVSQTGSLAYVPGGVAAAEQTLVWVDRQGAVEPMGAPPHVYRAPRLSPDGGRVAVTITDTGTDIWIYNIVRQTLTRLTFEGDNQQPQWTPDGERVTWRSEREGVPGNLFWKLADGTGAVERLTTSEFRQNPDSWSPDGQFLAFHQQPSTGSSPTARDIWILPLEGERKPQSILQTQFNELAPVFSPDGRWLAYVSDESGRTEIYVRPFPKVEEGKWQISTDGGVEPRWAPNGLELFYRNVDKMMAVDITTEPTFRAGTPRLLFEGVYIQSQRGAAFYDVTPDGQRFVMVQAQQEAAQAQINVVLNWFEELKRLVPTGK